MTHRLVVDLIQLGRWELRGRLDKRRSGLRDESREFHLRLAYLEIQPCAPQCPMGVPHGEIEAEALRHEKFQLEDISWFSPGDVGGV